MKTETKFDATLGGALMGRTWTQEQADALIDNIITSTHGYRAPEPEVPEDVKDLMFSIESGLHTDWQSGVDAANNVIIEAYRRGQQAK